MNLTLVILFTAISFVIYGYSSFMSKRMISEYSRWGFSDQRKIIGFFQLLGGIGLIAGIKVGEVSSNTLDSKSYLAVVKLNLQNNIFIPEDSVAKISSASLLGGQYVEIIPGASDEMLKDDETIYDTRDPVSLTDLLGQAVFSVTD